MKTTHTGKRCRELRTSLGLTAATVAAKAGIARETLTRIELGDEDNPRLSTLQDIAKALKVPVRVLLPGSEG